MPLPTVTSPQLIKLITLSFFRLVLAIKNTNYFAVPVALPVNLSLLLNIVKLNSYNEFQMLRCVCKYSLKVTHLYYYLIVFI